MQTAKAKTSRTACLPLSALILLCSTVSGAQACDTDAPHMEQPNGMAPQSSMFGGNAQVNRIVDNVNEGVDVYGTVNAIDMVQVLNFPEINAEQSIETFDEHDVGLHRDNQEDEASSKVPGRSGPQRTGTQNPRNLKRTIDEKKLRAMLHARQYSKLLLGREPQKVFTRFCEVDIASGAAALLVERDGVVSIFGLHDERPDGVTLKVAGKEVHMHPGDEIVLTSNSAAKFADVHEAGLATPQVRCIKNISTGAATAYQAEFSIPKCLLGNPDFKKALTSSDAAERRFANKMMKTAVIMNMITSSHGQFKPVW